MIIDFYILDTPRREQAMLFACKLVEQAHVDNQPIFIHTPSAQESEKMDQLLWTYRDHSFLPHEQDHENAAATITIGHQAPNKVKSGTLVNLTQQLPDFYLQYHRIIEIVYNDAEVQQFARERYKLYRDAKYELNTHKLKATEL